MAKVLPFGKMSQAYFEQKVRELWAIAAKGGLRTQPAEMAVRITQIILAVREQPELLEGRAVHNLGREKTTWLKGLIDESEHIR